MERSAVCHSTVVGICPAIVDSANLAPKLAISAVGDGFGPSDHSSFYARNLPVLQFFTDLHDDYHRATDDVDKINAWVRARACVFVDVCCDLTCLRYRAAR